MPPPTNEIRDYYDQLAPTYDKNRFGNTYGRYIHQQEEALLGRLLNTSDTGPTLDLACGTGRHLQWATHGLDLSEAMIAESQQKFPDKNLQVGSALETPYQDAHFTAVYAFHLYMHLQQADLKQSLREMHRIIRPGGQLLFDIPSLKRRKLIRYQAENWHGAFSLDVDTLKEMIAGKWQLESYHGILALPIHRMPNTWRLPLQKADNWLCQSPIREYSSYLLFQLRRI